MNLDRIKRLLKEKENIHLEFKMAATSLPGSLFETICAMLNREGGDILLGVNDSGDIAGVDERMVQGMITDLVNLSNNSQKLDPPYILFPQVHDINGRKLIHIQVPASSQIHKTGKVIYDRSNDGDFKVDEPFRIAEIANRKRNHYTEEIVYPKLRMEDFKQELFTKVRNLIRSHSPQHPWLLLDDRQIMEISGLWKKESPGGQQGFTLAAVLLFGKDLVIQNTLAHYKIDALVRVNNLERYDDRLYVQTNLIDAYDLIMDFIAKHLPDKFYLEVDQRVSLRAKIFREIVANLIIHREYISAAAARLIIYRDRVETQNANNPHGDGPIDPTNFVPLHKNPLIAKFFIQLGRAEELGSGILTTTRLIKEYSGKSEALFIEGKYFKTVIPIPETRAIVISSTIHDTVNDIISHSINDTVSSAIRQRMAAIILELIKQPGLKSKDLATIIGVSEATIRKTFQTLAQLIEFRGAPKTGGYFLTDYTLAKLSVYSSSSQ